MQAAVEAQFLSAAARHAKIVETGAFRVHFRAAPDPFYRTVAVPTRRPIDWHSAICAMQTTFVTAGCQPQLEFLDERWPDLAPALDNAGLVRTGRREVMVTAGPPAISGAGLPVHFLGPNASRMEAEAYLEAVHHAFAQSMDRQALQSEPTRLRAELAAGGCEVAAILAPDGSYLAGASLIGISHCSAGEHRRVAELAGVWTAPCQRGRGLASRVAAALVGCFVGSADGLVWLAAETERNIALYARLGFQLIGWQSTYSAPSA